MIFYNEFFDHNDCIEKSDILMARTPINDISTTKTITRLINKYLDLDSNLTKRATVFLLLELINSR